MMCEKCQNDVLSFRFYNDAPYCKTCYDKLMNNKHSHETTIKFMLDYLPSVKKIVYNDPATILIFNSGKKSVVKCQNDNTHDLEKAILFAYVKYVKKEYKRRKKYNDSPVSYSRSGVPVFKQLIKKRRKQINNKDKVIIRNTFIPRV